MTRRSSSVAESAAGQTWLARMLSESPGVDDDVDETSHRILDAACEQFGRVGIQRSTMEAVAQRAGVSRITVYRRFANRDVLVERVVRREFRRYFDQFLLDISRADTAADRVVVGFVSSLRAIRGNPLIGGLMTTEPSAIMPSMIADGGQTLATVTRFVAGQLRREQAAGNISEGLDVDRVAELMVRVTASFLAIPSHVIDLDDDDQVAEIARQFLVPMLQPTGSSG